MATIMVYNKVVTKVASPQQQGTASARQGQQHASRTVMVVEDYEDNRFMMKWWLEVRGYRVVEASNGLEAVRVAQLECPDLILMDLSLPLIDGLTAALRIREFKYLRDVPIVVISGHDEVKFCQAALTAGCNEFVTKPINLDQLEDLLNRFLPRA